MSHRHLPKRLGFVCALAFLLASLAGCYLPTDEPCTADELTWVADVSPVGAVVDTLTPTLSWSYPDPSCHPDHYLLTLYDQDVIRWPNDYLEHPPVPIHRAQTTETDYRIPAEVGLLSGTTYFWEVMTATDSGESGGRVISWFTVGPRCHADTRLLPPLLEYPPNGQAAYFPGSVDLEWDNQNACLPAGGFRIEISTQEDFSSLVWYADARFQEITWISSHPPLFEDCQQYFWRVQANPEGGGAGVYSETWSFILMYTGFFCPLDLFPTLIPHEPIRLPPSATVEEAASCRAGPGLDYPIIDYLEPGQVMPVEGQNQDRSWWYVLSPNAQVRCWVSARLLDVSGDIERVPLVEASPPPGPTETGTEPSFNCAQYNTDPTSCNNAANFCVWDSSIQPNGACVNR
ncbi:MAG: SH3 domain-containing protein [Anaerolineales bacterium]|nr:SH3 domain-containing protein [Anaerolineales bacterium]